MHDRYHTEDIIDLLDKRLRENAKSIHEEFNKIISDKKAVKAYSKGEITKKELDEKGVKLAMPLGEGPQCQSPQNCESLYYYQVGINYCHRCGKSGLD